VAEFRKVNSNLPPLVMHCVRSGLDSSFRACLYF